MDDGSLADLLRKTIDARVPGIAVTVVDADGVRGTAAAGAFDLESGTAASPGMACPWFSMTKIVTATAAMRLGAAHFDPDRVFTSALVHEAG